MTSFANLAQKVRQIETLVFKGEVIKSRGNLLVVKGLSRRVKVGDFVSVSSKSDTTIAEVLNVAPDCIEILPENEAGGHGVGDVVIPMGRLNIAPDRAWLGRVVDALGRPLDGKPILSGVESFEINGPPPSATTRKPLGARVEMGLAAFNTFLPIVIGQRLGLFSGSGVGKSTLLGDLCRSVDADVVVVALIGERGREVLEFVEKNLDADARSKAIIVAATSDQSPLMKRRAAWTAMTVAEYFRDLGKHVLFLCDSLTRFAEAHREVSVSGGEALDKTGFPVSTAHAVMRLCERAGPGPVSRGDISAIFSVLVPGSDMDEPIADMIRGVLDGHVVLSREIAERGRFPAVDVLRSVSRSLPDAATDEENEILANAKSAMAAYRDIEVLLQTGLYSAGSDPAVDRAIEARPKLEAFLTQCDCTIADSFARLSECLKPMATKRIRS